MLVKDKGCLSKITNTSLQVADLKLSVYRSSEKTYQGVNFFINTKNIREISCAKILVNTNIFSLISPLSSSNRKLFQTFYKDMLQAKAIVKV